jgi:predicted anti-sigma-YlaC factor YlaD
VIDRLWNGTHEETGRHLSDALDGELRGLVRFRVFRHLARCELCGAAFQSLKRTVAHLRSLRDGDLSSPSVADAVLLRIRHDR